MIILIDNYDSFTYNLVHYFQEIGEEVVVFRNDEKETDFFVEIETQVFIISPGPSTPTNAGVCLDLIKANANLSKPIPTLGVCLGHQAIAQAFNSIIIQSGKPVHGKVSMIYHDKKGLFSNLESPFKATRYHSLIIDKKSISKNLKSPQRQMMKLLWVFNILHFHFMVFSFIQKVLQQSMVIKFLRTL